MGCCGWRRADKAPPEDTKPLEGDQTVVARHLSRAEGELVAVTGGASLCRVGNGPHAGSVKYAEGRYAALRELRHVLKSPDLVALASVVELLDTWQAARTEAQGPAWTAYREGGVDELRSLVDDLTAMTEGAHRSGR